LKISLFIICLSHTYTRQYFDLFKWQIYCFTQRTTSLW